jgi:hypothetical protein
VNPNYLSFIFFTFQDDEEEKEIPFVRKRKQAAVSTSHGGERGNTINDEPEKEKEEPESTEDREIPAAKKKKKEEPASTEDREIPIEKKKKKPESKTHGAPSKDQGEKDERRKKKKNEGKKPEVTVREKSAIKKTKVHRALKIHTSSDSGEALKPTETPAQEKEILVETDQTTNAEGDSNSGPKENPLPQTKPLVEDQDVANQGTQDNVQKDGTTLMQNAPNVGRNDSLTDPEVENKEVNFIFFFSFLNSIFSSHSFSSHSFFVNLPFMAFSNMGRTSLCRNWSTSAASNPST